MKIVVDTHVFFWWLKVDRKLSRVAWTALEDSANEVLISAVVAWEVATKARIGKWPDADGVLEDLDNFIEANALRPLSISIAHARLAGRLPGSHRDPFDRMLVAQAQIEDAVLLTADPALSGFEVKILW